MIATGTPMLTNAARLLRCFNAECTQLSVEEAADRLALAEPAATDLLSAMMQTGLLERDAIGGRYGPGPMALDLASAYRSASPLIDACIDAVSATTRLTGHTGFVTVLDGADATAVFALPGTAPSRLAVTVSRLPARRSASGRTLLARLDDAEIARLHHDLGHEAVAALIARLDVLRDEGYEVSRSETRSGVESVAVAVSCPTSGKIVSMCIKYPAEGLSTRERTTLIDSLLDAAAAIAKRVGDTGFVAGSRASQPA